MQKSKLLLSLSILLSGCTSAVPILTDEPTSTLTPITENSTNYSTVSLNGIEIQTYKPDLTEYYYLNETTDKLIGIDFDQALNLFDAQYTGLIFFGYPQCAYCNEALPVFIEMLQDANTNAYYVNMHKEGYRMNDEDYNKFMEIANEWLEVDEDGEKMFFVPSVFTVKEGVIVGVHTGLFDDISVDTTKPLDEDLKIRLMDIYQELFSFIQ